ncbi:MAG: hypothetical protein KIT56_07035 [Gammaproteobacteria bacterium]|nr:hypothetical protein [Gammaproteobacteria bacterium]MCW5583619.1 hypothetical protein [Gammaproteobacteria bacterium]
MLHVHRKQQEKEKQPEKTINPIKLLKDFANSITNDYGFRVQPTGLKEIIKVLEDRKSDDDKIEKIIKICETKQKTLRQRDPWVVQFYNDLKSGLENKNNNETLAHVVGTAISSITTSRATAKANEKKQNKAERPKQETGGKVKRQHGYGYGRKG